MTADTTPPTDAGMERVGDATVMRVWRECGLPEWFLGNGGTNHKLVAFAAAMSPPAPAQGASVPEGWKLVPVEPTPEMLEPMARAWCINQGDDPDEPVPPHGEYPRWYLACGPFAKAYRTAVSLAASPAPHQPAAGNGWQSQAACDVLAERRRQVEAEGWTPEHDDCHDNGEMAIAAAAYAYGSCYIPEMRAVGARPNWWPWDMRWWKPKNPRADLVRAGALILAEIERLDRAAPPSTGTTGTGEASGGEHG